MAYTLKTYLANKSNYGGTRSTNKIKYIVIHYTGNDGDTAENNGKYFRNNVVKASAHYFIDSDSIVQSVPDNYIAWAVGGNKYSNCSKTGGGKYYGICTNSNSLSIELCDDVKNDYVYPSAETIENAIEFVKLKMKEYNIPQENVIRHFDVVGKSCPFYWCGSTKKDNVWKTAFWNKLVEKTTSTSTSSVKSTNKIDTVKEVQKWANTNYKSSIAVDGIYGSKTKKALIKILQTELNQTYKAGLTVDGIWGNKTKSACPTLKKGAENDVVGVLQALLICNGYKKAYLDKDYGSSTYSAVMSYQKDNELEVDGIAGKNTFAKLCG